MQKEERSWRKSFQWKIVHVCLAFDSNEPMARSSWDFIYFIFSFAFEFNFTFTRDDDAFSFVFLLLLDSLSFGNFVSRVRILRVLSHVTVLLVSSVGLLPPPWVLLNHVRNIFLMMKPPSGWKLHLMNVCLAATSQLRNVLMWRVESCARASLWNIKTFPFKLSDFCNSMNWIYEKANDPQSRLNHIVT